MRLPMFYLALALISSLSAQTSPSRSQSAGHASSLLKSGKIPDLTAVTDQGKPVKLRELCAGKFTVLASGCLTCPEFHKSYPEIEAARADYASDKVQFYYFYKSLRHPELGGYVDAQNIKERLLQLAEARKKLATQTPWLADTMDDSLRIGLGANSQSVYLISPEGEILYANGKIKRADLRNALTKALGAPEKTTLAADLKLPRLQRPPRLVNEDSKLGVKRPEGLTILKITPADPEKTYYVKLRAEGDDALIKTGTGRLFLGFYPDPIHDACWNNLTQPMRYQLTLPEGMTATPAEASAQVGHGDKDSQPRQFWVDIKSNGTPGPIELKLDYFGCTPDMCMALTHGYTIELKDQNRGSRTYGMNRGGPRASKGTRGSGKRETAKRESSRGGAGQITQMDTNKDGSVSYQELLTSARAKRGEQVKPERVKSRFDSIDTNKDGKVTPEEFSQAPRGGNRPQASQ